MKTLLSAPGVSGTLAAVGHRIYCAFMSLWENELIHKYDGSFQASLLNELQRFDLWARNVGLYEDGHNSLDYRFRDAPSVYGFTCQLLEKLEVSILTSMYCCLSFVLCMYYRRSFFCPAKDI